MDNESVLFLLCVDLDLLFTISTMVDSSTGYSPRYGDKITSEKKNEKTCSNNAFCRSHQITLNWSLINLFQAITKNHGLKFSTPSKTTLLRALGVRDKIRGRHMLHKLCLVQFFVGVFVCVGGGINKRGTASLLL